MGPSLSRVVAAHKGDGVGPPRRNIAGVSVRSSLILLLTCDSGRSLMIAASSTRIFQSSSVLMRLRPSVFVSVVLVTPTSRSVNPFLHRARGQVNDHSIRCCASNSRAAGSRNELNKRLISTATLTNDRPLSDTNWRHAGYVAIKRRMVRWVCGVVMSGTNSRWMARTLAHVNSAM